MLLVFFFFFCFFFVVLQFTAEEKLLECQTRVTSLEADRAGHLEQLRKLAVELQEAEGAAEAKAAMLRGKNEQLTVLRVSFSIYFKFEVF